MPRRTTPSARGFIRRPRETSRFRGRRVFVGGNKSCMAGKKKNPAAASPYLGESRLFKQQQVKLTDAVLAWHNEAYSKGCEKLKQGYTGFDLGKIIIDAKIDDEGDTVIIDIISEVTDRI